MKKNRLALLVSAALLSSFVVAAEPAPVATVNGKPIAAAKVDAYLQQLASRGQADSPDLRSKIREQLIREEIVAQEAAKSGLDKSADFISQVELARSQILLNIYIADFIKKNPISEEDMKKEYERAKVQFAGKEYHARHIMVDKESDAKAILAELKKGKKFEELAKTKSKDTGSALQGGDLGWAALDKFPPEFSEALAKLPKGKITDKAVKIQSAYHIIKMEDTRETKGPAFEEMKGEIQQYLQNEKLQKLVNDLRAKAKVE